MDFLSVFLKILICMSNFMNHISPPQAICKLAAGGADETGLIWEVKMEKKEATQYT